MTLHGKLAELRQPDIIPATNDAGLKVPKDDGTVIKVFVKGQDSWIMYSEGESTERSSAEVGVGERVRGREGGMKKEVED